MTPERSECGHLCCPGGCPPDGTHHDLAPCDCPACGYPDDEGRVVGDQVTAGEDHVPGAVTTISAQDVEDDDGSECGSCDGTGECWRSCPCGMDHSCGYCGGTGKQDTEAPDVEPDDQDGWPWGDEPRPPMMSWVDGLLTDHDPHRNADPETLTSHYQPEQIVRAISWMWDRINTQQAEMHTLRTAAGETS